MNEHWVMLEEDPGWAHHLRQMDNLSSITTHCGLNAGSGRWQRLTAPARPPSLCERCHAAAHLAGPGHRYMP